MLAFETLMPLQPLTGYMLRLEIFTVSAIVLQQTCPQQNYLLRTIKGKKDSSSPIVHPWQALGSFRRRQSSDAVNLDRRSLSQPVLSFYPMSSSAGEQASPQHRTETDRLAQRK